MCSLFFHPLLYPVDLAFSFSSSSSTWPRFVLNCTQLHFEMYELLEWGRVLFKTNLGHVEDDEENEMRAY